MNPVNLKTHYSSKELANMSLTCLPKSVQGIIYKSKKECWISKKREGRGGGIEYQLTSLPLPVQEEIREKVLLSQLNSTNSPAPTITVKKKADITLAERDLSTLTEKQRQIADARMVLVAEVLKLQLHTKRLKAIEFLIEQINTGEAPEHILKAAELANAKRGTNRVLSARPLHGWVNKYEKAKTPTERLTLLAPGKHHAKKPEQISWLPMFLAHYRNTNGINLTEAHQAFTLEWNEIYANQPAMLQSLPNYDAVRRAIKKLPPSTINRGRLTGAALRATQLYIKRDWSAMDVNAVWIGDGHNMKLKVAHPIHGRPFSPEITFIVDGRTRFVTGWSLSLSENTLAVADALRDAIRKCGLPLIYYSDNGAGETGRMLDADVTGIIPRLGIHHETGIAGNPQGRGIIERLNKVIPTKVAKQFATFYGPGVDPDTARKMLVGVNSVSNAQAQGKELTKKQQIYAGKLPSWNQLLDAIENVIDWYNNQHEHSELPRKESGKHFTPGEYRRYLIEAENVQIERLSEIEMRDMFMPQISRKVQRGCLSLFNYDYSAIELADYDGQEVLVGYDLHDPARVTVKKPDGTFICYAMLGGHKRDAFPRPLIEKLKEQRVKGMKKRAEQKIAIAEAELRLAITAEQNWPLAGILLQPEQLEENKPEPIFMFESERQAWLQKNKKRA